MSKQKRIKKIVKSRLHRIKPDGDPEFATTQNKLDALASLNALADGTGVAGNLANPGDGLLLAQLGISNPGVLREGAATAEILDIDRDSAADAVDAFPRNAVEQRDTDGDLIGDNRDILETKVRLDAIFQDLAEVDATTALQRATGTLQVLMDEAAAVQELVNAQYDTIDAGHDGTVEGNAVAVDAAQAAILLLRTNGATDHDLGGSGHLVSVAKEKFTAAGLDQLVADIDTQAAQVVALKAEIDAMTATAGVKVKSPAVTGYANSGDSVRAKAAAAETGAGNVANTTAIATLVEAAKLKITKDITPDQSSGSKAMLAKIDAQP